jgi:integrase/recombinase XerD
MGNVRIPAPPKEVLPAFAPRDVQALLAAADARGRAMILLLLDTGVRMREFLDLNGADVDMDAGTVRVQRGKTGKSRTTFVSPPTVKALLAYYREQGWPEGDEPLWRNLRTGERLTDSGVRGILNDAAQTAGMKSARPHQFRRTFALWSLRQGVDVHTLAKLMGHADITVLKRYLDLDESDTRAAHTKADIVRRFLK